MIHLQEPSRTSFLQTDSGAVVLGEFDIVVRRAIYCLFSASVWRLMNEALMDLLINDVPPPPCILYLTNLI